MAISGTEKEFIGPGTRALDTANGSYVQNMIWYNSTWETRKGFGQLGEWTSGLSRYTNNPNILAPSEGYEKHLGSYLFKSQKGHKQIITIMLANVWDSNGVPRSLTSSSVFHNNRRFSQYIISIYDIGTRQRWEEVLYKQTNEFTADRMPYLKNYYQTNRDYSTNVLNFASEEQVNFVEFQDVVYFGSKTLGIYSYRPATYMCAGNIEIDYLPRAEALSGQGESSIVINQVLAEGVFSDAYTYYSGLPEIRGLSVLNNRLLYHDGFKVYFSDENYPASIVTGHYLEVPSETPITAIREINGNLLIYSDSETFLYQPSAGFFVHKGNLTKISESVGCLSANSITRYGNQLTWVDPNGVYVNSGTLGIERISDNIRPFFENFLTNPLSSYQTQLGKTNLTYKQPRISHKFSGSFVTLCYNTDLKSLFITFPSERITLVYCQNKEWSIWNYDSTAFSNIEGAEVTATNKVGVREFMNCDQLVSDGTDLYSIGLDVREENKIKTDTAATVDRADGTTMVQNVNRNQRFRSYFIGQYGKGGGLDRSVHHEDNRYGIGEWRENITTSGPSPFFAPIGADLSTATSHYFDFIIGKPQKMMPGFTIDGTVVPDQLSSGCLVPLIVRVPKELVGQESTHPNNKLSVATPRTNFLANNIYRLNLRFTFDKSHWAPMLDPASPAGGPHIKLLTKTDQSLMGGGIGNTSVNYAQTPDISELGLYNITTGVPDINGNQIRLSWTGATAGDPLATNSFLNLYETYTMGHFTEGSLLGASYFKSFPHIPNCVEELFVIGWIPFVRLQPTEATSGIEIDSQEGWMMVDPDIAGDYYRSNNYYYNFSSLGSSDSANIEDKVAQGVDWIYASEPIGLDQGVQVKARGLYTQLKSTGMSTEHFDNGWTDNTAAVQNYRLFNGVVSADNSQWMGQIVDQDVANLPSAIQGTDTKTSIGYPNLPATGEQQTIRTKVLDSTNTMKYKTFGNAANQWGASNTDDGTVLIDDEQFGTIATSTSTRGEWVNWMFFGFVLDKAEKLVIRSAKAILRRVGGRRRKGHSGGRD